MFKRKGERSGITLYEFDTHVPYSFMLHHAARVFAMFYVKFYESNLCALLGGERG